MRPHASPLKAMRSKLPLTCHLGASRTWQCDANNFPQSYTEKSQRTTEGSVCLCLLRVTFVRTSGTRCAKDYPMKTRLHYVLGWIDRLLLVTVAGLMVVSLREIKHLAAVFERSAEPVAVTEPPPQQPEFMVTASRHTISFSPGGVTESRVSQVARSLS